MPVAARRANYTPITLRTPQARVLAAIVPERPEDPVSEWPTYNRAQLGVRAGYTAISGTVTRALNGIREGSSSGDSHLGLLALGLVEEFAIDLDGHSETNYRATARGVRAYGEHLKRTGGKLPELKDRDTCTNDRYKKKG